MDGGAWFFVIATAIVVVWILSTLICPGFWCGIGWHTGCEIEAARVCKRTNALAYYLKPSERAYVRAALDAADKADLEVLSHSTGQPT